jgi:hypothetical protein
MVVFLLPVVALRLAHIQAETGVLKPFARAFGSEEGL